MAIDWAKKLEEAGNQKASQPGGRAGFTIHDLKENTGMSNNNCYLFVKTQMGEGKMEKFKGNTYSAEHNQLVRTVWYRFL